MAGIVYIDADNPYFEQEISDELCAERAPREEELTMATSMISYFAITRSQMTRGAASAVLGVFSTLSMISVRELLTPYAEFEKACGQSAVILCRMNNAGCSLSEKSNYALTPTIVPFAQTALILGYKPATEDGQDETHLKHTFAFAEYLDVVKRAQHDPERFVLFWFEYNYKENICVTRPVLVDTTEAEYMHDYLSDEAWYAEIVPQTATLLQALADREYEESRTKKNATKPLPRVPSAPAPNPPSNRPCGLPVCRTQCTGSDSVRCPKCKSVYYCSRAHRKIHARAHHAKCGGGNGGGNRKKNNKVT